MAMVTVGDIELWVDRAGHGDPVVLHPGLGYASWCWQPLIGQLADSFSMLAVDTRGAGRSDKPPGPYSIDLFADDVAAVVTSLDLGPVHFVGHSMGGFVAQRFATRHRGLARSIVLASTHPGQPGALGVPPDTLALWEEASSLDAEGYARTTFATSFREGWAAENQDRFEELLAARLEFPTPPDRWRDHFNAGGDFADAQWPAEELDVPALVVHGTADRVVPFANTDLFMSRLPRAELAAFDGAGHNIPLEEPHLLASTLREFWATT